MIEYNEKFYKKLTNIAASNITIGIISILSGLIIGIISIIYGSILLRSRKNFIG